MPTPLATTKSTTPSHGSHAIAIPSTTEQNTRQTNTRSKNRLHAGIDSACYMTRSGSSDSSSSPSPPSSATSTPTIGMSAMMAPGTAPRALSKRSPSLDSTTTGSKATFTSVNKPTKTNETTHPHPSRPRAGSISVPGASILKKLKPTLSMSTMDMSQMGDATSSTSTLITTPTTPSPRRTTPSTDFHDPKRIGDTPKGAFACQCPPPLEFPENVKQEMKREEEEHRQRECGLYAKIIELQIEVANLKGEKESLSRVVSRRDKMLLELQVQLQAMEFVCRENEIKVDIDMCPDEAIENWSFKESDEVYQRIILTTQELLRNGARCLEEGVSPRTQSRPRTRISSTSSFSVTDRTKNVVGLSANSQPHLVQDVDPLLFKKTSRPGTLKFDMQTLLHSEQEYHNRQSKTPKALDLAQVNLAVERGPRRALDIGDDRSGLFRNTHTHQEADDEDDDDDEGQESEFEELGEDMIKYVELQSSMTPRRESRSSSFSKPAMPSVTPDMSTAVLMKNMWGSRRNTRTTPNQHPIHNGHFSPPSSSRSRLSHRGSSSSSLSSSSNSILEDYYARPCEQPPATVGLGLSIGSSVHPHYGPHFNQLLSAPPMGVPPSHYAPMCRHPVSSPGYPMSSPGYPSPGYPMSSPGCPMSSPGYPGSYYDHTGLPMMVRSATSQGNPTAVLPPPMMPLPPLPAGQPRYSYRDHTKSKLLESRRPTHGRTCSHGFAIENVGQFLKRKTYGKMLTREIIYRGHRRRDSV
ncbi:hypothetical protein CPB97_011244 [Podila verticillata]|nr:hypothetical protein CPB97_011244 [Podila verticillata]